MPKKEDDKSKKDDEVVTIKKSEYINWMSLLVKSGQDLGKIPVPAAQSQIITIPMRQVMHVAEKMSESIGGKKDAKR
jgi:hypothetical protein